MRSIYPNRPTSGGGQIIVAGTRPNIPQHPNAPRQGDVIRNNPITGGRGPLAGGGTGPIESPLAPKPGGGQVGPIESPLAPKPGGGGGGISIGDIARQARGQGNYSNNEMSAWIAYLQDNAEKQRKLYEQNVGKMEGANQFAYDPRISTHMQGVLRRMESDRYNQLNGLFDPGSDRFIQAQRQLSNQNALNQHLGLYNSTSADNQRAEVIRKLNNDRAEAYYGAGEKSRADELGEYGDVRKLYQGISNQYGSLANANLGAQQQFAGNGANLASTNAQLGQQAEQNSIRNQLDSLLTNGQLKNMELQSLLELVNLINGQRQQTLENVQGKKSQNKMEDLINELVNQPAPDGGLF